MDLKLDNKKVLITGSTAGIGFAIAEMFATEGADVIVNGRSNQRVEQAVSLIKSKTGNSKISGVVADV